MEPELISFDGTYLHKTDKAILFTPEGWVDEDAVWLPISCIVYDDEIDYQRGDDIEIQIPEWLVESNEMEEVEEFQAPVAVVDDEEESDIPY